MKYSDSNPPMVCMMKQSTCYKGTTQGTPVGILWHDTGAGNPWLKRYVQPDDNASNEAQLLAKIGTNPNKNDFNHITRDAGLNCWIGKLADGTVSTIQTMPWNYRPWGCGSGKKGSCNGKTGGPFWIQFEICDDGWSNATGSYSNGSKEYFLAAYKEACEITAYLCKKFNIDPNGYVNYNGVKVPTILCHYDSYKLQLGSGHYDIYGYFNKYGYNMDAARADVTRLLGQTSSSTITNSSSSITTEEFKIGDLVGIKPNATYYSGKTIASWVLNQKWYIQNISGDRAVINKSEDGRYNIMSAINTKYLLKTTASVSTFSPYIIRVTTDLLNVRSGPSINYEIKGSLPKGGAYTIIEEKDNWGKLKSGIGWISLKYTERVK